MFYKDSKKINKELDLTKEINRLEDELSGKYYEFGKEVHEKMDLKIVEINSLVDKIVNAKLKLKKLKNTSPCPICRFENSIKSKCCIKCGNVLK